MYDELHGRVAVVTGAGQGIGLAIVRELARNGCQIVAFDVNPETLSALGRELGEKHVPHQVRVVDVADWSQVGAGVESAISQFGEVNILVNNAGIAPKRDGLKIPILDMDPGEWNRVLAVNLTGMFHCCKAVVPSMMAKRWGRIVNISSRAARMGGKATSCHYTASKAGVLGLTRSLAIELGPYGITVNAVLPGRIVTPMTQVAAEHVNQGLLMSIPLGRLGQPEDVAGAVVYLCSDSASFVSGSALDVGGAQT